MSMPARIYRFNNEEMKRANAAMLQLWKLCRFHVSVFPPAGVIRRRAVKY